TAGRVFVAGQEVATLDDRGLTRLRRRTLGFVFQFHHLLPALTAEENVMVPLWAERGRADEEMRRHARELLGEVGLAERAGSKSGELSGGQQQRV
ncbi:MAG TPA: ABC transporter ATP-binding protein, partial [Myxococcales bacterium]|nr:ABC transporter ATP-binding protein [Myxococcales bacterium]